MYRSFYEGMDWAWLPAAAMVFFFAVFFAVLFKAYLFNGSKDFEKVASLPLDDNEVRK